MSMRQDYEAYLERHGKISGGSMGNYYLEQESRYVWPFHIYGPVWYVGDSWVCVHLIAAGAGPLGVSCAAWDLWGGVTSPGGGCDLWGSVT